MLTNSAVGLVTQMGSIWCVVSLITVHCSSARGGITHDRTCATSALTGAAWPLAGANADRVGGDDGGDGEPVGQPERLAKDNEAGQRGKYGVDAHEDAEEPGRDPPQ